MTPKHVLEYAKENEAKVVDLRFMDFPGVWQHFTVPLSELEASSFEDGFGFDDIRFESSNNRAFYEIDSVEGIWNSGREECPNLGYKPRHKEGYFPVPPMDKFQDIRTEMLLTLEGLRLDVECQHHEVATAGQAEIRGKDFFEIASNRVSRITIPWILLLTPQLYFVSFLIQFLHLLRVHAIF
ncbi:MAG: hypothetical protein JRI37_06110 [Deltaproteobacteria bacterium]|nr:hypothetical protein [Deltaproteobacteria bacterium]OQY09899.1 MAG: hypothetical protein B6I30_09145 [Desulfobacteraceae bacterium 4572_187]